MSGTRPDPYQEQYAEPYIQPYPEQPYYPEQQYAGQQYTGQQYTESYQEVFPAGYQQQSYQEPYQDAYQEPYQEEFQGEPLLLEPEPEPEAKPTRSPRSPAAPPVSALPAAAPPAVAAATARVRRSAERGGLPTAAVLLLPVLATLVMGGFGLGTRQIGQEESATWWAAGLSWGDLGRLLDHTDVVLAPFYALMHCWVSVAGTSPAALRLPSLLAMAAAAGTLALLGRRMFGASTGLVAGLLFAVLPVTSHYAQDARPFGFAALAALVAAVMLYRALDHEGADRWGGYALALLLTGLFHLVTATVLIPFLVLVLVTARSRLGAWASVTAVCVAPMFAFVMLNRGETGQASAAVAGTSALTHFPQDLLGSNRAALAMGVLVLLGAVLARRAALPLLTWIAVPPLLLFGLRHLSNLFDPSYFVFTVPAWALLGAAGLCGLVRLLPGRPAGLAIRQLAFGLLVSSVLAGVLLPDLRSVRQPLAVGQPDFASAAQWLTARQLPGDGIAYTGGRGAPQQTMGYALRNDKAAPRNAFLQSTPEQAGNYTGTACLAPTVCAKGFKRIWLVSTTLPLSPYAGMSIPQATLLKTAYKAALTQQFPGGVTLVLLEPLPVKA